MNNLKKLRVILGITCFTLITLLFLDFTGTIHAWLGWLAKIQFVAAVTAVHILPVILLIAITLLLGRVYCSVICPLGIFQDIISKISSKRKKFKYRFRYSKALTYLRGAVLLVFISMFIIGIGSITALLEPYSIYGRMASNLLAPIWQWGNNVLAYFAERADSYAFYTYDVWLRSLPTFIIAALSFVIIVILAWKGGRTYCNTICPVGTFLGFLAKYSLYKPRIDKDKCNSCGLCEMSCKSSCIDSKNKTIDYSRCVTCFDCTLKCKKDALHYALKPKNEKVVVSDSVKPVKEATKKNEMTESTSRRNFLATSLVLGSAVVKAQEMKTDGGLAVIVDKKVPSRDCYVVPAGALSIRNFATKCTGCQLCVSVCPNQVLRPSTDLSRLMQPEMSFERGYCRPECTKCSDVCPAGAITPIAKDEKSSISIGTATWIKKNCIVVSEGISCGNCASKCPTGAIQMIPYSGVADAEPKGGKGKSKQLMIPVVNLARCIGCGACEYVCPSAPFSAIYVEGKNRHSRV
ncbi:MAG: 4Fe-4S binding protein [Rikenellaceae bacterium]